MGQESKGEQVCTCRGIADAVDRCLACGLHCCIFIVEHTKCCCNQVSCTCACTSAHATKDTDQWTHPPWHHHDGHQPSMKLQNHHSRICKYTITPLPQQYIISKLWKAHLIFFPTWIVLASLVPSFSGHVYVDMGARKNGSVVVIGPRFAQVNSPPPAQNEACLSSRLLPWSCRQWSVIGSVFMHFPGTISRDYLLDWFIK